MKRDGLRIAIRSVETLCFIALVLTLFFPIKAGAGEVIDTISVGDAPLGIAVTPNGSYVYVTNQDDDTVSVIRTSDNTVVDTISVGDGPYGIAVTPNGNYVYVTNFIDDTVSVIRAVDTPVPDIKANGSDGPVVLSEGESVSVTVGLDPGNYEGFNPDWWIAVSTPFDPPGDWYAYVYPTGWWPGINLCVQAPLFAFSGFEVLDMVLPLGSYTFYFAIGPPDGMVTTDVLDSVEVNVN